MAVHRIESPARLIDRDKVIRALGTATRFVAVHASMLMAAAMICLFAMVIVWMLFEPSMPF